MVSSETQKFIKLVEAKEDIEFGVRQAFEDAHKMPIISGHGGERGQLFYLISSPTEISEYQDTISVVNTSAVLNIGAGDASGSRFHGNYQLYLCDNGPQKQMAISDAIRRWMKKENVM
jgi:hypothetical protein